MSGTVSARHSDVVSSLLAEASESDRARISTPLGAYPLRLLELLVDNRSRIRLLRAGESYRDASRTLRRLGIAVDSWPVPPAGLFVVEERTVYLRSLSPMTIGHEVAHAIACALGGGAYRSGFDPDIRAAFAAARAFVTPYAACGLDEYFAESMRAYADVLNDARSPWPPATRKRLQACDPAMYAIVAELFAPPKPETPTTLGVAQ